MYISGKWYDFNINEKCGVDFIYSNVSGELVVKAAQVPKYPFQMFEFTVDGHTFSTSCDSETYDIDILRKFRIRGDKYHRENSEYKGNNILNCNIIDK